ncbi:hypothetical protein L484_003139 [Morus notabilis]|uniref:Uncharacterized protein n=1 Tax=Morus notabilis TaxID=981085 RepID=W9SSD5_9ROSA|nr:uncharacterized protein LOC21386683 [Morus notabilis]EXC24697.1 hypothetical protein L484_003139 [Morus notabilis]
MGNCSPKGVSGDNSLNSIRILTDSGTILEFKGPKLASEVLNSYPNCGIYLQGHRSSPVANNERLLGGKSYYLLPLRKGENMFCDKSFVANTMEAEYVAAEAASKKMSHKATEFVESLANGSALEVLPSGGDGVWRVKLMIGTKQLEEILSEQGNTEALIETMRMAASGSASLTPRHSKSGWRSNLSSLFNKVPADHCRSESAVSGYLHC